MTHPPGTIGILSDDLTRYAWAMAALRSLQIPPHSQMTWVTGHWIASAVNKIMATMRAEDEWVCILTDDNPVPPDMLLRLLDHQVPLVAPLVCLRHYPYQPSCFHQEEDGTFTSMTWEELTGKTGLLPVASFGGPGVVIRREVIETVGMPFFENAPWPLGRFDPHEDLWTFQKCRDAGFQPLVDLDCVIGHCFAAVMTPERDPETGRWGAQIWAHRPLATLWPHQPPTSSEGA